MRLLPQRKPNIARLQRKRKVDELRAALFYWESFVDEHGTEWDAGLDVRVEAAKALSSVDDPAVAADLAQALSDPQPAVRSAALDGIASLGHHVGAEALVATALEPDQDGRALPDRAVDVLTGWRLEGTPEALVETLLAPGSPEIEERHRDILQRFLEADPRGPAARKAVSEALIASLQASPDSDREERIGRILGWLGPPAVDRMLDVLSNGGTAPAVVRAGGLMGDARLVDGLIGVLGSADADLRRGPATAASTLNHTRAVPALLAATQDAEQPVRDAASAALNRMGTAAVIAGLAALMPDHDEELLPAGAREGLRAEIREEVSGPPPAPAPQISPLGTGPGAQRRRAGLVERLLGRGD